MTNDNAFESTNAITDISGSYVLDPTHTRLGFSARHAMVTTVRGSFKEIEGAAVIDSATPANSSVKISIVADSVETGSADRDAHLRSSDFFGSETNPTITFTSTAVGYDGDEWEITGDLTINGVTKSLTISFEEVGSAKDPWGQTRVGFEGHTTIKRSDWGLTFNSPLETGGVLISEKVKLDFDISAIKQA